MLETRAAGLLGSHLLDRRLGDGFEVIGLSPDNLGRPSERTILDPAEAARRDDFHVRLTARAVAS